jgi:hypothetical protein
LRWKVHVRGPFVAAAVQVEDYAHRAVRANQRDCGVHLYHRQPPAGCRDRATLTRVRLLPNPQHVQFGLKGGPADNRRQRSGVGAADRR